MTHKVFGLVIVYSCSLTVKTCCTCTYRAQNLATNNMCLWIIMSWTWVIKVTDSRSQGQILVVTWRCFPKGSYIPSIKAVLLNNSKVISEGADNLNIQTDKQKKTTILSLDIWSRRTKTLHKFGNRKQSCQEQSK